MQSLAGRLATAPRQPWPNRPVPVALTITDLDVGGAERALVALATGLDRRRWTPSVVALGVEGALVEPLRAAEIPVRCLGLTRDRPITAVVRLTRAFREIRPWLAQSFLFHANVATRLASRLAGVRWVVGGLRVAERRANGHLWLDRATIGLSTGSVCVSKGVRDFSVEVGRLPADRLVVIPNGIDCGLIDRAKPLDRSAIGVPNDAHLAVFVGRLDRQKGVADLLAAASVVASKRPGWHLAIAGDGPEAGRLRVSTDEFPSLAGRVHWLGRRDDVPALLKAADLLVLPSLWEGMPNVVLEGMAACRAVVGTEVEGTSELVVPGETGWLIPPGAPARLAEALLEASDDPGRLRRYGKAGRARVEAEFAAWRVVAAYEDLWARLLGLDPESLRNG